MVTPLPIQEVKDRCLELTDAAALGLVLRVCLRLMEITAALDPVFPPHTYPLGAVSPPRQPLFGLVHDAIDEAARTGDPTAIGWMQPMLRKHQPIDRDGLAMSSPGDLQAFFATHLLLTAATGEPIQEVAARAAHFFDETCWDIERRRGDLYPPLGESTLELLAAIAQGELPREGIRILRADLADPMLGHLRADELDEARAEGRELGQRMAQLMASTGAD